MILQGRVQGVGFRPFVWREATRLKVSGYVTNTEAGVEVLARGPEKDLAALYKTLTEHPPRVARVLRHSWSLVSDAELADGFHIIPSRKDAPLNLQLTPDFALCPECTAELADPENRRYGYPFISCVSCGPRWAITRAFPFEREHTHMDAFPMCPECLAEYTDPSNRRFHSQTNSCPTCGVPYSLEDAQGRELGLQGPAIFQEMARLLATGHILAVQNNAGYLLCCDAGQSETIDRLRHRKNRPIKPLAVLYPNRERIQSDFDPTPSEWEALESAERPIVLLTPQKNVPLALDAIAPGLSHLGVMLPYSGVLELLSKAYPHPVVATSGNLHGSPICYRPQEAREKLASIADAFFHHGLEIAHPQDDSVVRFTPKFQQKIILRRSRGYAPNLGTAPEKNRAGRVLAMGADLKSTLAYIPNTFLYLSEYLGNLSDPDVQGRFERTASAFTTLFGSVPETFIGDGHPGYHSSRLGKQWAAGQGVPYVEVPHHFAHFAALLGEHEAFQHSHTVLGVVWDGTGYGLDGQVWGGEFLTYRTGTITRVGHVAYFDWLAGDKMAREPRLSLFSLADASWPEVRAKFSPEEFEVYARLKAANRLKTASMGRLFDAVAALLGVCDYNSFEGEAAMKLEALAATPETPSVPLVRLTQEGDIPAAELLGSLRILRGTGMEIPRIIGSFMYTLAALILEKAEAERATRIGCSGGVFQNAFLVDALIALNSQRFELLFHQSLSPNDENIAYGQLMYHQYCQS